MGSVTLRVILWTPSGPCAPWGASGPATTSPGSITLIIKFRDSPERGGHFEESPTEILQRMRFYKDRDSTKNEILQRTRFYKERDSTKNEILQRTIFSRTRRALEESPTEIHHHRGPAPHGGHLGQQQQVQ